jgi:hypothetical protein
MDQPVLGARDVLHRQLDFSFDARRTPQEQMRCALAELMPAVAVAMARASVTATVPVGARKVVSNTIVRGR